MGESAQKVWVTVNGEMFLVEVEDLNQRPVVAFVEGSRFEIDLTPGVNVDEDSKDFNHPEPAVH
ncbi:MAG: hypothetical protein MUP11_05245, partial [Anaerolineales bacterium]|nr:hypothetical protein [Anaerolineales bacterium]